MNEIIETRKRAFIKFLTTKNLYIYILLVFIIFLGCKVRLINNASLQNEVLALDPYLFYRWSRTIVSDGSLPEIDYMRAYPDGYVTAKESFSLSYVNAYLYKLLNWLNPKITLVNVISWYPVIFFALGLIVFFILIKSILGEKTALFSTGILSVAQGYLYRTFQGFADKEALGMFLFYLSLLFFYYCWNNEKHNNLFGVLAGLSVGALGMIWGGVTFTFIIIGSYVLMDFFFNFDKNKLLRYTLFLLSFSFVMLFLTERYGGLTFRGASILFLSFSALPMTAAFGLGVTNLVVLLLKQKVKLFDKINLPLSLLSLIIMAVGGLLLITVFQGPTYYVSITKEITDILIYPFQTARHTLTVVENRQPYFNEWKNELGIWFVYLFIIGAMAYMYDYLKKFSKKWHVLIPFIFLLLAIPFSRFSATSLLNGTTGMSILLYLGSIISFVFVIFGGYIYAFFKDKKLYEEIKEYNKIPMYLLLWFLLFMISARGVVRLFFVFTPIASFMAGYLFISAYYKVPKDMIYKALVIVAFMIFYVSLFSHTTAIAKTIGPSFTPQWKSVTSWMRTNTPEGSVFAHWWDYGYWVQTMGERPTVLDGGQPVAVWNYFMGRHVLTAQSELEALEFLYAHNVSYLLIDPSDIGKYGAYSSIGSDAQYDRLSYTQTFFATQNTDELKIYSGGYGFDEDYVIGGNTPLGTVHGQGGIDRVVLTLVNSSVTTATVQVITASGTFQKPISCVYYNNIEYTFHNADAYQGCFVVVPAISGNQYYPGQAGVFLSRRGKNALWSQLYLRNAPSNYFQLVYQDDVPVGVYQNIGIWGPIKVWRVNYPENITFKEEYLSYEFPEGTFWS